MKSNYIKIIESELPRLTEDQLYKVLVLIKNTNTNILPKYKNHPFYIGRSSTVGEYSSLKTKWPEDLTAEKSLIHESRLVRDKLLSVKLNDCYGLISFTGTSTSDDTGEGVSNYIMFSKENVFDGFIEICYTTTGKYGYSITYRVSTCIVGEDEIGKSTFFSKNDLFKWLDSVAKVTKYYKPNYE